MLDVGTLLQHRYLIVRELGRGGMGAVYEAVDQRFGSTVALKETILDDEHMRQAFRREANLLNGLRHANLPYVMDYFAEGDGQFLVMQYIPGEDLASLLAGSVDPFDVDTVLDWGDQLLGALEYLHGHEPPIVHRDVKPQNVKLTPRGEAILLDFGLAKGRAAHMTGGLARSVLGYTPHYAPFEQVRGAGTDGRSDLYALAATLYHLLTRQMPPDAVSRCYAILEGGQDPLRAVHVVNPAVPEAVSVALQSALAFGVEERPASASHLRAALRTARTTRIKAVADLGPPAEAPNEAPPVQTLEIGAGAERQTSRLGRISVAANAALGLALLAVAATSVDLSLPASDPGLAASAMRGRGAAPLPGAGGSLEVPRVPLREPSGTARASVVAQPVVSAARDTRIEPVRLPTLGHVPTGTVLAEHGTAGVDLAPPRAEVSTVVPPAAPIAPEAPQSVSEVDRRERREELAAVDATTPSLGRSLERKTSNGATLGERRRGTVERRDRAQRPPAAHVPVGGAGRRARM